MKAENGRRVWTMREIKAANITAGFHFFDADTLRFFRSKILPKVYQGPGGVYFVTEETGPRPADEGGTTAYTVRCFRPERGDIPTVGAFHSMTREQAQELARESAEREGVTLSCTVSDVARERDL